MIKSAKPRYGILVRQLYRPYGAAVFAFFIVALLSAAIIWRSELSRLQIEREHTLYHAGLHANAIQIGIERALSATYSLAALVREGNGDIEDFEATAREMLLFYPGAASFQLAPSGIVRKIAPIASNENVIGHNLLKDPARNKEAFLARNTGKLTLAGPFDLIQGGVGAVGLLPVFMDDGKDSRVFWGFTIVLIRFPDILEKTHLSHLREQGFQYTLWRHHPDTSKKQVIATSLKLPIDPVDSPLILPNGFWYLSVAPSGGWGDTAGLTVKAGIGFIFSLLVAFLTRALFQRREEVVRIAKKLKNELGKSETHYKSLVTSMAEGICLHMSDGKITAVNPAAEKILGYTPEQVVGRNFIASQGEIVCEDGSPFPENLHPSMVTLATGESQTDVVMGVHRPDGSLVWVSVNSQPIIANGETAPSAVMSTFHDITERKIAEEKIKKLNQELELRVKERTLELSERNKKLKKEINERKLAEAELCKAKEQLEVLSAKDPLTGLANRRRFDSAMVQEHARHARSGAELSIIMFDVDHFKAYNDSYGHVAGDRCLQQIAMVTEKNVERPADIAARYGGEEFACILPETDLNGAKILAERIRSGISRLAIPHRASPTTDHVSASFGVATISGDAGLSIPDIITLADKMLYRAKATGRNRVEAETSGDRSPAFKRKFVQLVWQDTFRSGNHRIDSQHQELFCISNDLLEAIETSRPIHKIAEMATRLLDAIASHFHDEETILEAIAFQGRKLHTQEHTKLYEKGVKLVKTFGTPNPDLDGIFKFLIYEVVFLHMRQWDREFFSYLGRTKKSEGIEFGCKDVE